MLRQIARVARHAMARKVIRCAHQIQRHRAQVAGQQAGVFQIGNAQGQVKTLGNQVHLLVTEVQLQLHIRVALHKARQQGRQLRNAERHGGSHAHHATQVGGALQHFGLHRFAFLQDACGAFKRGLAAVGQHHAPRGAVKQRGLQACFQPRNGFGDGGLGQRKLMGGACEGAGLGHLGENSPGFQIR